MFPRSRVIGSTHRVTDGQKIHGPTYPIPKHMIPNHPFCFYIFALCKKYKWIQKKLVNDFIREIKKNDGNNKNNGTRFLKKVERV